MPLSINVGLSRKASRDYQSAGLSINVNAELDQSLLARPDELQQRIDELYEQARLALDRQAELPPESVPQNRTPMTAHSTAGNSNQRPYRGDQRYRRYDRTEQFDHSEGQIRGTRGNRVDRWERGDRQFREDHSAQGRGYRSWDRRDGNSNGSSNGNARGNGNGQQDHYNGGSQNGARYSRGGPGMTQSQLRAIEAIAQRLGIDAIQEIHHEFGLELEQLSIRQTSQAIDHLKQLQPLNQNQGQPANSSNAANAGNPESTSGASGGGGNSGGNGQHE